MFVNDVAPNAGQDLALVEDLADGTDLPQEPSASLGKRTLPIQTNEQRTPQCWQSSRYSLCDMRPASYIRLTNLK